MACADIDRMVSFYTSVFGFAEVSRIHAIVVPECRTALSDGGYLMIRLQSPFGERLKLFRPDVEPAPPTEIPKADIIGRRNQAFLTLIVDDVARTLADIVNAGGQEMDRPTEIRPGLTIAFAGDPEGNLLEITRYASIAAYRPDLIREMTP